MKTLTPQSNSLGPVHGKATVQLRNYPFGIFKVFLCVLCCFSFQFAHAQLSGIYTINPSAAASATNYLDFHSAVSDLDSGKRYDGGSPNGTGVSGPVIIKVADGIYDEKVHIVNIPGSSATNPVIFGSASADSTKVILTSNGANTDSLNHEYINYTLMLEDVSYVTFNQITITRSGTRLSVQDKSDVLKIFGGSQIKINGCMIISDPVTNLSTSCALTILPDSKYVTFSNIYITNNHFFHGNTAVSINGQGTPFYSASVVFDRNIVDSCAYGLGFYVQNLQSFTFTRNKFTIAPNNSLQTTIGEIELFFVSNLQMSGNEIYALVVSLNDCGNSLNPALVANNLIHSQMSIFNEDSATWTSSIFYNVYYNTIYKNGGGVNMGHNCNFANNLIFDTTTQPILARTVGSLDFNNYFSSTKTIFGTYSDTTYATLSDWQSGTHQDIHSKQVNPDFINFTNLIPQNRALNFGTPISGVTTDINGKTRSTTNPTVGAYEISPISITSSNLNFCKGTCDTIHSPILGTSYTWSTGDTTKDIKYCATTNDSINLIVFNGTDTLLINHIKITANTCVWPGDANYDKMDDINDVLAIGVAYSDTGTKRPSASTNWTAQPCNDWANSFTSSANHKHADCNGDGVVDSSDMVVVALNYSKTHAKARSAASGNPNDPPLTLSFSKDSALAGDTVLAAINLGSVAIPASNVYGVVMKIGLPSVSGAKYFSADFTNSWLGTYHKNMVSLVVNDTANKDIAIGLTRTDHKNMTGAGPIGVLSIIMPENLGGKREVKQFVNFTIEDYKAISANESSIPLNPISDSILAYTYKTGIANSQNGISPLTIYPNPAGNVLHIKTQNTGRAQITITDVLGNVVYTTNGVQAITNDIDISLFTKGIYMIELSSATGIARASFVKE